MQFINFSVINTRGDSMNFCLAEREACIVIEKVYNMGTTKVVIE